MRRTFILFIFLISFLSSAQEFKTIEQKVSLRGTPRAKRVYSVLESDGKTRHGAYTETLKGEVIVSGSYMQGQKDGAWLYRGLKGLYEQKGSFKKGKKVGLWTYKKGQDCYGEEYYNANGKQDSSFAYNAENKLIQSYVYNHSTKQGLRFVKNNEGEVSRTEYLDTIKFVSEFYDNGQLFHKKEYRGEKLWNASAVYSKDGDVIQEQNVTNGEGVLYSYSIASVKKGNLKSFKAATFSNGEMNGLYLKYNSKGEVIAKGTMKNNNKVGYWQEYSAKKERLVVKNYNKNKKKKRAKLTTFEKEKRDIPFIAVQSPCKLFEYEEDNLSAKKNRKKFSNAVSKVIAKNFKTKELIKYINCPNNICRTVAVFKINNFGEISELYIRAPDPIIEKELRKVFKLFPTFIPASQNGKMVNILFHLPVVFSYQ